MAHPDGELATARATAALGGVLILSTSSNVPIEEVAAVPDLELWFQLYAFADEDQTGALLDRAVGAGAKAIVLTIDVLSTAVTNARPVGGFKPPADIVWAHHDGRSTIHTALDWAYVRRLQQRCPVPIVLKGVLHPDDAVRAADEGVAAIVVSNHGGRFIDGSIPTAFALPAIAEAAAGRLEVYVDGGIRRGGDVLRALALGAKGVLVGRPVLWALAIGGEAGVETLLRRIVTELRDDAVFAGIADIRDIPRDLVVDARR
jgi:4-hydroxymandelate oxidase